MTHLLCVLFEQAELEALVQLQLPDVPHLMEVLPRGVELIQQTGHLEKSKNYELLDDVYYDVLNIWNLFC